MDWNKFLTPEAIATYVVAFISLIVGAIGFFVTRWLSRQRPKKIALVKINESEMLKISPDIMDDIVVTYKQKPITSLYQTVFAVKNYGEEVIDNIKLKVQFWGSSITKKSTKENLVIEASIKDEIPERESLLKKDDNGDCLEITLSYLNPQRLYKDSIEITVFSLEPISHLDVTGGGRGWASEFFDQDKVVRSLVEDLPAADNPLGMVVFLLKRLPNIVKLISF